MYFDTSYAQDCMIPKNLKRNIIEMLPVVRKLVKLHKIDALAFRGFSGAGIAFPLSYRSGIPLMNVRKQDAEGCVRDQSHGNRVEGDPGTEVKRYAILDDFIASGHTINEIIRNVRGEYERRNYVAAYGAPECHAIFLYSRCTRRSEPYSPPRCSWYSGGPIPVYYLTKEER